ncbi:MAG: transcriptional regulator [Brotaphodocola sp.]
MTNKEIFDLFIPLVDFLGEVMGENTEILLHDLSQPDNSVIAISHGFHSGRTIGSPVTDLAMDIQKSKSYKTEHYLTRYRAVSKGKQYLSSTYYIKNEEELIGMLCLNTDIQPAQYFTEAMKKFMKATNLGAFVDEVPDTKAIRESLDSPIASLAESIISRTILESGIAPDRMTREEKMQIVWALTEQDIPRMKGAVSEIAKQLQLSESTVYRYISQHEK